MDRGLPRRIHRKEKKKPCSGELEATEPGKGMCIGLWCGQKPGTPSQRTQDDAWGSVERRRTFNCAEPPVSPRRLRNTANKTRWGGGFAANHRPVRSECPGCASSQCCVALGSPCRKEATGTYILACFFLLSQAKQIPTHVCMYSTSLLFDRLLLSFLLLPPAGRDTLHSCLSPSRDRHHLEQPRYTYPRSLSLSVVVSYRHPPSAQFILETCSLE